MVLKAKIHESPRNVHRHPKSMYRDPIKIFKVTPEVFKVTPKALILTPFREYAFKFDMLITEFRKSLKCNHHE